MRPPLGLGEDPGAHIASEGTPEGSTSPSLLGILSREDDGWDLLLGRVLVSDHDVEERDDDACERHREYHGETAEDDSDQRNRDEDDEWREANRMPEDSGNDEVVLEQPNPEDEQTGHHGKMRGNGESHADRDDSGDERSYHRDDLHQPGVLLRGFPERLQAETGLPVHLAEQPLTCVALGAGRCLDELETIARSANAAKRGGRRGAGRWPH